MRDPDGQVYPVNHLILARQRIRPFQSLKTAFSNRPVGDASDYVAGSIRSGLNRFVASRRCVVSSKYVFVQVVQIYPGP